MGGFRVELDKLDRVGKERLPTAIENLQDAATRIGAAREVSDGAFRGQALGLFDVPGGAWQHAAQGVVEVLQQNRLTLDLGRKAIVEIARRYRALEGMDE